MTRTPLLTRPPLAASKARSGLLRAGWNLADQVISSATNALLSVLIARSVSSSDFGGFSVAFTIFSVFIGLTRALAASPLSVRFAGAKDGEFRRAAGAGAGTALTFGLLGGVLCVGTGLLLGGAVGISLTALGVVLPGLLVQDAWRLTFFAEQRARAAAANDACWAVLQVGAILALTGFGVDAVGPLVLAWGLSAGAAGVLGVYQSGTLPTPSQTGKWLRSHRDLTKYLALEYVTLQGGHQLALLIIASVAALEAVGALRGAQTLLGPATILMVGMHSFALPEFSRRRQTLTTRGWMRGAYALSAFVTGLTALWGAIFLFLPDSVGEQLLGDSWAGTEAILLAMVFKEVAGAAAIGPVTMLYAMDRARVTLAIHSVQSPLMLVGGVGGVLLGGAPGAAWGFAAAFWLILPPWWIVVRREARAMDAAVIPEQRGPEEELVSRRPPASSTRRGRT